MGTLGVVYSVNEINLANLLTFNILAGSLKEELRPEQVCFLLSVCKTTCSKIDRLQDLLKNFSFYTELDRLRLFLEVFQLFYGLAQNSYILRENQRLVKQIDDNEKLERSISQIHFENNLIATRITEQERELATLRDTRKDPIFSDFVFDFYQKIIRRHELIKMWT